MIDQGDRDLLVRAIDALESVNNRLSGGGNSTVRIDAGGVGVWAATTACICTLLLTSITLVVGMIWIGDKFGKIETRQDRQQDYMNAIYQAAPQLQPAPEKPK